MPKLIVSGMRVVREALADRAPHALGGDVGAALVRIRQQHGELLAAHARGKVDAAVRRAQDLAGAAQDLVPARMSEPVVDLLEVVEVAEHEAHGLARAAGPLHLEIEGLVEAAPVSHPGDGVLAGGVGEPLDEPVEPVLQQAHEDHRHDQRADGEAPPRSRLAEGGQQPALACSPWPGRRPAPRRRRSR